jgi:hypothetical protein
MENAKNAVHCSTALFSPRRIEFARSKNLEHIADRIPFCWPPNSWQRWLYAAKILLRALAGATAKPAGIFRGFHEEVFSFSALFGYKSVRRGL